MSAILIGYAGFINGRPTRHFLAQGARFTLLDTPSRGRRGYSDALPGRDRLGFVRAGASDLPL